MISGVRKRPLIFKIVVPQCINLPLRLRKAGRLWCGGARESDSVTCHNGASVSKTKQSLRSPCFSRSFLWIFLRFFLIYHNFQHLKNRNDLQRRHQPTIFNFRADVPGNPISNALKRRKKLEKNLSVRNRSISFMRPWSKNEQKCRDSVFSKYREKLLSYFK